VFVFVVLPQITHEDDPAAAAADADATQEEEETEMPSSESAELRTSVKPEHTALPGLLTSPSGLPLISVRSSSSEWTDEDMMLDWTQQVTVHQLQMLRDFLVEGMQVNVVEEKVL